RGRSGAEQRLRLEGGLGLFPRRGEERRQLGKTLSGGEQQMVAPRTALPGSPQPLPLEQPSTGHAATAITESYQCTPHPRKRGVALLPVEQNVGRAAAISSSCYVMEKGRIIKHGPPADVMADEAVRQRLSV